MPDMSWDGITAFVRDYAGALLLGGGLLGLLAMLGLVVWAKRTKRPLRPFALALSMNLALLLNAEGMWVIAVDELRLPKVFAVLVFAVFEICFLTATSLAAEQYRRTTTYDAAGNVVSPGHPGPMLYIAALIAGLSGVVVASNAVTGTEKLLRLALPCMIFLMWWAALTAAGQRRTRGRFAYSPRRLAERWGWLIPDDDPDLERLAVERRITKMAMLAYRIHHEDLSAWRRRWSRKRLSRMGLNATNDMLSEVQRRVALAMRAEELTSPEAIRHLGEPVTAAADHPALADPDPAPATVEPAREDAATSGPVTNGSPAPDPATPELPAGDPQRAAEEGAVTPPRQRQVATPRTVGTYQQWLTVWQAIQAEPAENRVLAERHRMSERTITNIRSAGQNGQLTEERLAEMQRAAGQEPVERAPVTAASTPRPTAEPESTTVDQTAGDRDPAMAA
ncbi:hypothetical protein [Actinoplanes sp. G11-F43]|uniref:hypothetical protein n=1 Tax=Actinoplanes sp. G11-F43 TaxID=3424130 RepID=UPI003D33AFAE